MLPLSGMSALRNYSLARMRCSVDRSLSATASGDRGAGPTEIARTLNNRGERTPGGGDHWYPSYVWRLLQTSDAPRLIERIGELLA